MLRITKINNYAFGLSLITIIEMAIIANAREFLMTKHKKCKASGWHMSNQTY
jgi:hypothetical protein